MNEVMKPSGVEWIGEIPQSWGCVPLRVLSRLHSNQGVFDGESQYVALENIEAHSNRLIGLEELPDDIDSNVNYFDSGDVLFGKLRPYLNKVFCPDFNGCSSSELLAIKPTESIKDYLFWLLTCQSFIDTVNSQTYGVKMPRTSWSQLRVIYCPFPSKFEQKKIADFLNKKCELISYQADLIVKQLKTLEVYKQSLIHEAVTKGLNPNAAMKDSGFKHIGEIPIKWGIKPLKYVTQGVSDSLSEETSPDYKFRYVDIGSVSRSKGIETYKEMSFGEAPSRARKRVKQGDTIVSTVRTYLKAIALVEDDDDVIVSTGFAVLRPLDIDSSYLFYLMKSECICQEITKRSWGIAYPAITESELIQIYVPVPSIKEQQEIAAYLDKKCAAIDKTIDIKRKQLETLKLERQSLIYEYVTGKKRVAQE